MDSGAPGPHTQPLPFTCSSGVGTAKPREAECAQECPATPTASGLVRGHLLCPVATCPAPACWDMLAKPGWAVAFAHPRRTLVAGKGQHSLLSPACLGFCSHRPLWGYVGASGAAHSDVGPQPLSVQPGPKSGVEISLNQALFLISFQPQYSPTRAVFISPFYRWGKRNSGCIRSPR